MEKERKGLFGRILDFWKEKVSMGDMDSIGFWNEMEPKENHFAEMGAVASLMQEETKKVFWEEPVEPMMTEKKKADEISAEKMFFVPKKEEETAEEVVSMNRESEQQTSKMLMTEVFWNGGRETDEQGETEFGKAFLWEMPEEEQPVRSIIPVMEETKQEETTAETEEELWMKERPKREEKQAEIQIDIEKLMQQMTKKLWEERESCGRRLR